MSDTQKWAERNHETTPPDIGQDECKYFWFDGIAHYNDWEKRGNLVLIGKEHTDRVIGLVLLLMAIDVKHPKRDERGHYVRDCPLMIAEPETNGYELHCCEGKWCGPVDVPNFSDDFMPTLAFVEEYIASEWSLEGNDADQKDDA